MAYTKYSLTPANNTAAPPDGAPEGMLPSAVNDTMRDMMAQIRDCGDGIRGGTYTMTAPVITGGSINGTTIGATTASTGKFSTLTNSALTSGRVTYAGTSGVLQDDADFTFNGTTVTMANDASISGLTVGKGGGAVGGNTVVGASALTSNTTGSENIAVGFSALNANTTGTVNTAIGYETLITSTTATQNVAVGHRVGYAITSGGYNSGLGALALRFNTTGQYNTAVGNSALFSNTTASNNTAVGYQAGYSNTTGAACSFIGYQAGYSNTTGVNNTMVGYGAGYLISTGSKNSVLGLYNGNQGGLDIRTASNHIVLSDGDGNIRQFTNANGFTKITNAGASASLSTSGSFHEVISDNIDNAVLISVSTNASYTGNGIQTDIARNTTNNSFYAFGYFNRGASAYRFRIADSGNATNTNGSYGTISDIKNKENIVDATPKLEKIKELQVRNFNFKGDDLKQIGFVAQEFEQVFPSMIEEHKDTDVDGNDLGTTTKSIKTSVLVPILVKALQELTAKVEALEAQLNNGA